jgi:hypothetical protein
MPQERFITDICDCIKRNSLSETDSLSVSEKKKNPVFNVNRQSAALVTRTCYRTLIISDMYTYSLHIINLRNIVISA